MTALSRMDSVCRERKRSNWTGMIASCRKSFDSLKTWRLKALGMMYNTDEREGER
jgi:hypothetical protein